MDRGLKEVAPKNIAMSMNEKKDTKVIEKEKAPWEKKENILPIDMM